MASRTSASTIFYVSIFLTHNFSSNGFVCWSSCHPQSIPFLHDLRLQCPLSISSSRSVQATIQGFESKGVSRAEAENLLRKSVEAALDARDIYNHRCTKASFDHYDDTQNSTKCPILIAASIGSYGLYLADGSEYSGDYGEEVNVDTLKDFHRRRLQVLAESGADLIAFETIPNKLEAKAYAELLEEEGTMRTFEW